MLYTSFHHLSGSEALVVAYVVTKVMKRALVFFVFVFLTESRISVKAESRTSSAT